MAAFKRDVMHEPGERVEARIETRAAAADLQDLGVAVAELLRDHGVGCEAVLAAVDLAHRQADHLALLRAQRAFRRLQRQVGRQRMGRMRSSGLLREGEGNCASRR